MNEKIKKLAQQAGFQSYITTHEEDVAMFEKFAELIVRECAELTLDYKNDDHYNGWLDYRDEIKKHFGIKE